MSVCPLKQGDNVLGCKCIGEHDDDDSIAVKEKVPSKFRSGKWQRDKLR